MINLDFEDLYQLLDYVRVYRSGIMLAKSGYFDKDEFYRAVPQFDYLNNFDNFYQLYCQINQSFFSERYIDMNLSDGSIKYTEHKYNEYCNDKKECFLKVKGFMEEKNNHFFSPIAIIEDDYENLDEDALGQVLNSRLVILKTEKKITEEELKNITDLTDYSLVESEIQVNGNVIEMLLINSGYLDTGYLSEMIPDVLNGDDNILYKNINKSSEVISKLFKEKKLISIEVYKGWE